MNSMRDYEQVIMLFKVKNRTTTLSSDGCKNQNQALNEQRLTETPYVSPFTGIPGRLYQPLTALPSGQFIDPENA